MSNRLRSQPGIKSYKKAAMVLAGTSLLLSAEAQAADGAAANAGAAAGEAAGADDQGAQPAIVITGERYRINTLNTRLPDLRDAPQSISVIPRSSHSRRSSPANAGGTG